jgi:hypothetical protein
MASEFLSDALGLDLGSLKVPTLWIAKSRWMFVGVSSKSYRKVESGVRLPNLICTTLLCRSALFLNRILVEPGFQKTSVSDKSESVPAGRGEFDSALSVIVKPARIVPMDVDAQLFFVRRGGGSDSTAPTLAIDTQHFMFGYGY